MRAEPECQGEQGDAVDRRIRAEPPHQCYEAGARQENEEDAQEHRQGAAQDEHPLTSDLLP